MFSINFVRVQDSYKIGFGMRFISSEAFGDPKYLVSEPVSTSQALSHRIALPKVRVTKDVGYESMVVCYGPR